MALSTLIVAALDDPLPWVIAVLIIGGTAIAFLAFLWFFRVTRLLVRKKISCPEERRRATVELITRVGELGPYRDVRSCTLRQGEKGFNCGKSCLTSSQVLEAPFLAIRKDRG